MLFKFDIISLDGVDSCIKITNDSPYKVILSSIPKKPKRKIIDFMIIPPKTSVVLEEEIDMDNVSFRFEK